MFVRWKSRPRWRHNSYEAGDGPLLIAYATEARREGGKPRQRCTYLAGIRANDTIDCFEEFLQEELRHCQNLKYKEEQRERLLVWNFRRRLQFWCAAKRAISQLNPTARPVLIAGLGRRVLYPTTD